VANLASEVKLEMKDLKITIRTRTVGHTHEPTYVQQYPMGETLCPTAYGSSTSYRLSFGGKLRA